MLREWTKTGGIPMMAYHYDMYVLHGGEGEDGYGMKTALEVASLQQEGMWGDKYKAAKRCNRIWWWNVVHMTKESCMQPPLSLNKGHTGK